MTAVISNDALRFTCCARGVEDIEGIGCINGHAVMWSGIAHRLCPVMVYRPHLRMHLWPLQDDGGRWLVLGEFQRPIEHRLVFDHTRSLDPARCRDDHRRCCIINPDREFVRGETAKDHRMHGPEPGSGQHRDDGLRHHRHVDDHAITLGHPEACEHTGESRHLLEQLRVRQRARSW